MGAVGVLLLSLLDKQGGKPIFDPIDNISPVEKYLFTFLYSAYIGASLAMREGRALDLMTNNHLIADCGLISLSKRIRQTIRFEPISTNEPIDEISNAREPLSPSAYHTVIAFQQELPRRRSTYDAASSSL
jgi:hypothetical protein